MFGWALGFGVAGALAGAGFRQLALGVRPHVERRVMLLTPIAGLLVGGLAVLFAEVTGESSSNVLFSGQFQLPELVSQSSSWSTGALLLLMMCKGLAYSISLGSFRGGPVFGAMFIGAAAGILGSHFPGLPLTPAVAMGIGATCCSMLRLPLTATLLATLLLGTNGVNVMPLVIVAVLVAYVLTARLTPVAKPV